MTHPSRDRVRHYVVSIGLALFAASMPQLVRAQGTPTRFGAVEFVDKISTNGVPLLLKAKLETDSSSPAPISGQTIYFQIFRFSTWLTIPDDGITTTSLQTNSGGIASVYQLVPENITAGLYQIRALYGGNATYAGASLTRTLEIKLTPWEERSISTHTTGTGVPLVLVHGNGSDQSPELDYRWQTFKNYIVSHPAQFEAFDTYIWKHDTSKAVGFNGVTGNAAELHDYVHNTLLPRYPAGTRLVVVAHSRGGLVTRSFMNRGTNGDLVYGLITLGTPHHGSPFAVPDWDAIMWGTRFGTNILQILFFNAFINTEGQGFETGRLGSLNLAWDNHDGAISGTKSLAFDVTFANGGTVYLSAEDLNRTAGSGDPTVLFSNAYKTTFGTLDDMNLRDIYRDKLVTIGSYDDNLADNLLGSFLEHVALESTTAFLASASTNIVTNGAVYFANDGLVPLQSALFLDISGGMPFSSQAADQTVTLLENNISARKIVNRQYIFSGKSDGIKDHLDLLDTTNNNYWSILSGRIQSLVREASAPVLEIQASKPSYATGDTVTAQEFRVRNPSASTVPVHLVVSLTIPTIGTITLIDAGSDGSFQLPPNINVNLGPFSLIEVSSTFPPRGDWEFKSVMKNPVTGTIISQDLEHFRVQ